MITIGFQEITYNALRGFAIPIGIDGFGHTAVIGFITQKAHGRGIYIFLARPDEFHRPCRNCFRTFRRIPQDKDRFTKSRSFFLDSARIRKDDIDASHEIGKRFIIHGFNEVYAVHLTKDLFRHFPNLGILVHGENGFRFRMETAAYFEDGRIKNVYLEGEYGGFAIHIMQK